MTDGTVLAYCGHHRCASSWVIGIFRRICRELDLTFGLVNTARSFDWDLCHYLELYPTQFLAYRNAECRYVQEVEHLRGFHVVRDPRDIVVSAYFSHLYSHPTIGWPQLIEHRERLKIVSQEDGLRLEMEFLRGVFRALREWDYQQDRFLEIRMEDMIVDPGSTLLRVCQHLGILADGQSTQGLKQLSTEDVLAIVDERRFSVQAAGRNTGEEDVESHYRKGIAGDWRNYFTQEHVDVFKQKYNDVLLHMNYETVSDW